MDLNKKIYSDGEIEDSLISTLKNNGNVNDILYNGGAIFHNFNDSRENLLNWYPFNPEATVLEIGAGMGALTGYLCDVCKHVTAFEQSSKRAEIIFQRYKDKTNLEIICDDIFNHTFSDRFDYILLIGVLEYAGIDKASINPYLDLLNKTKGLLKVNGVLLLAIENQFGLKYWCGAAEDHTGIPFDGINGYEKCGYTSRYNCDGVLTFSKNVLKCLLNNVGLNEQRWYYPLPDYKFPMAIFSDSYLPTESDINSIKFSYPIESQLIADEKKIYKEIIDNDVFPFFANSFFVEASCNRLSEKYIKYASLKRDYSKQYRIATVFDNEKQVLKNNISKQAKAHLDNIVYNTQVLAERKIPVLEMRLENNKIIYPWVNYKRADDIFQDYLNEGDIRKINNLIILLEDALRKSSNIVISTENHISIVLSTPLEKEEEILEDGYIDMTFVNSFYDGSKLIFFDQEWKFDKIPIKFILFRAIKYAYKTEATKIELKQLYEMVGINASLLKIFENYEIYLLAGMMDKEKCTMFDPNMYHEGLTLTYKSDCFNSQMKNLILENEKIKYDIYELNNEKDILNKQTKKLISDYEKIKNENDEIKQENLTLQQVISNKEGHIEQLLEVERVYEREKNSRSYKIALVLRKIGATVFPVNSKRRFFAGIIVKIIKHPRLMLRVIHPRRIKNFFVVLKEDGMEGVRHHYQLVEEVENSRINPFNVNQFKLEKIEASEEKKIDDYEKISFMSLNEIEVSIIIPVHNQFDYTYHCLKSISKNSGDIQYEIIVADDCSTDLTTQIENVISGIKVIHNKENLRFLLNCNNAAKASRGKYIVFLNNDTQVQEDWLRPMLDLMEKDEKIGMTGSKLIYPDGWLQEAGGIFWSDASAWNYGNRKNPDDPEFNYVKEVDYISGASIMIRATLWNDIGGFDERFAPAYYEDSDLAFEIRKRGYKVVYQPLSVVIHFEGISNGTNIQSGQKSYQLVNQQKFYEKWKNILEKEHFPNGENIFLAKDRSRFKKHILVIDHYVPHFDQDAGGKCTYMYLLLFVKMGFKVTFIGDNFYKHEPYTTILNQQGVEVLYGNYYYNNWQAWLKENLHYFDYIYLQRPHISIKYIDHIKRYSHAKILYFAHDLHHVREYREYLLTKDEEKLKSSEKWKKIEYELFKKADVGHVVGTYEQEVMQKAFPKKPIRNIPLYIYEDILTDINKNFRSRKDILYVGGFGHAPNIDAVLWFGQNVLPKILLKFPDLKWHVVGGKVPLEIQELASENIYIKGFLPDEELHELYYNCRIAVVPLRVGAGVKGKVVEAAYYQIPIVTTNIGAEGLSTDVGNMVIEDDADMMAKLLCELYVDYNKLQEMSDAGITFISKYFTEETAKQVLLEDIKN